MPFYFWNLRSAFPKRSRETKELLATDPAPKDLAPEDQAFQSIASDESAYEDSIPENSAPEDSASEDSVPDPRLKRRTEAETIDNGTSE